MCEKCIEIDRKLDHYSNLTIDTDPLTAGAAEMIVADLRAEKRALHPDAANDPDPSALP